METSFSRRAMRPAIRRSTGKTRRRETRVSSTRWTSPSRRSSERILVSSLISNSNYSWGKWQGPEEITAQPVQLPGTLFTDIQPASEREGYEDRPTSNLHLLFGNHPVADFRRLHVRLWRNPAQRAWGADEEQKRQKASAAGLGDSGRPPLQCDYEEGSQDHGENDSAEWRWRKVWRLQILRWLYRKLGYQTIWISVASLALQHRQEQKEARHIYMLES